MKRGGSMGEFLIYRNSANNSTLVSNTFIDKYMPDANSAQVKVYLHLLRMEGSPTSVSQMADMFNYPAVDICRALKYWEKHRLLALEYDMDGSVVGVRLLPIPTDNNPFVNQQNTQNFVVHQAYNGNNIYSSVPDNDAIDIEPTFTPVEEPVIKHEFVKPDYSADQLKMFNEREDTKQLMFIASSYLGRTLNPSEIRSLLFISEELHFSEDLIDHLLTYCIDNNHKSFNYIEKVAIDWANNDITTPSQAKEYVSRYNKSVYSVMKALGKSSEPTPKEADYVRRWTNEFGFSSDVILEACERSVMSTDKHRFAYADAILKSWHDAGVVVKKDIANVPAKAPKTTKKPVANTSFHRLDMKHDYDFSLMEKELLKQK